jgi:urocanate hydratase
MKSVRWLEAGCDTLRLSEQVFTCIPAQIPDPIAIDDTVDHAPSRPINLTSAQKRLALRNALRYFPSEWHAELAPEFASELQDYGHIYMHRFRPLYSMHARPISEYPAKTLHSAAIMLMIQNNLDPSVAQYPHELVTYGGNGSVFQNWIQYRLTMSYLSSMSESQTLVMYSGHPLGLFPSDRNSPRVVVTNGMVVPNHSSQDDYELMNAVGITQYGQMTAGSYMYIGPQGIVHGTTITLLNAARRYLGKDADDGLEGVLFVSSGLGGMSGAQAKAAVISGAVAIIAECNEFAAKKRYEQGWLSELHYELQTVIDRAEQAKSHRQAVSLGYVGNIVDLLEGLIERGVCPELGSDQTSLHNPWLGGYMPAGLSFEDATEVLRNDPQRFRSEVRTSLIRHAEAINTLSDRGMHFWDYGNAFLLEASKAGADGTSDEGEFRYPSYVEDIMGPIYFDYGFGPFRWVCTSGTQEDLDVTDQIASDILKELFDTASDDVRLQYADNLRWIENAREHDLVVGSKARILYADESGRRAIASAFNQAVSTGQVASPVVIGRDHHDVGGTDSPYRETANIKDGSNFTADMSVHNFVGDAFRGATWVSLHNGGGVGWGEAINGGFGMVLDGTVECGQAIHSMISWDVNNGIARRAWANNPGSVFSIKNAMDLTPDLSITLPSDVDERILSNQYD